MGSEDFDAPSGPSEGPARGLEARAGEAPEPAFGVAGLLFLGLLSCGVLNESIAGSGAAVYTFNRILLGLVLVLPVAVGVGTWLALRRIHAR